MNRSIVVLWYEEKEREREISLTLEMKIYHSNGDNMTKNISVFQEKRSQSIKQRANENEKREKWGEGKRNEYDKINRHKQDDGCIGRETKRSRAHSWYRHIGNELKKLNRELNIHMGKKEFELQLHRSTRLFSIGLLSLHSSLSHAHTSNLPIPFDSLFFSLLA